MPNKAYNRAASFENRLRSLYLKRGYFAVRAAGSHGAADVVVLGKPPVTIGGVDFGAGKVLLSAKAHEGLISKSEIVRLLDACDSACCDGCFVVPKRGAPDGIKVIKIDLDF